MIVGFLCLSISITCSILVSIILKKNANKIDLSEIILINYIIAAFFSLLSFRIYTEYYLIYMVSGDLHTILIIGCLLPLGFISMAQSIKYFGVAKSEIFQRMSIVIPIIASFIIFNDKGCSIKTIQIIIAIFSIFLLLDKQQKHILEEKTFSDFKWPVLVCLTYGICDILFKKISSNNSLTNCLFLSFLIASIVMVIYISTIKKQFHFSKNNIINGLLIGALNWVNIISYIKAHKYLNNMPSTVFIVMNLGVVISGTIVGIFLFKEQLNKNNILGIFMAILSILISIKIRA
ncbi:EamA family transporter [Candidatus Kinetoplastidibacterium galati]|uniref:EamA domain-containing protein n=1 Tax=Candidatus Kinetoplastidibacterium galati TCC219 TaxID=1208921 RepID=M1M0K1_9PROT|nr:EamA family transporter [Candidatus Kinetoplastibacterium galatii]AGF48834.1 hypothetical protein ST1E_0371 [Candidatus Kinetoplastibacterium galatii TCC219]